MASIVYHPSSGKFNAPSFSALKEAGVKYIRVTWVDYSATIRIRIYPIRSFEKILASSRPGVSLSQVCLSLFGDTWDTGITHAGAYVYAFDMSSLRLCTYAPGHASVFGWFQEKTSSVRKSPVAVQSKLLSKLGFGLAVFEEKVPSPQSSSVYVALCPRSLLAKLLADAQQLFKTCFLAGFETEFILLTSQENVTSIGTENHWSCASPLYTGTVAATVMEEIAEALERAGVDLDMYHAEGTPGQFEVVTSPLCLLEAADALTVTRETIYNVASKHGMRATLAPRPIPDTYGSAAHAHISIHTPPGYGKLSDRAPALKSHEASFLQSILENLAAICAFSLPLPSSYERVSDDISSFGQYVCWGTENKDTPVRLSGDVDSHHFELRCVDGCSNPYLLLACVVAAAIDGLKNEKELEFGDCRCSASSMDADKRTKLGISTKFPTSIEDSRTLLRENEMLNHYLGKELISNYLSLNQLMQKQLAGKTPELARKKVVEFY